MRTPGPTDLRHAPRALTPARVAFATSRARTGEGFGGEATEETLRRRLWLGEATAVPDAGGGDWAYESANCAGTDDFATPDGPCGCVLDAWLDDALAADAVPLISVHGFQYRFEEAVARTAQVAAFLAEAGPAARVVPLLFTWPSAGALGAEAYADDQTAAQRAGPALARFLEELAPRLGRRRRRVNLLAHSMGNWALQHGLASAAPALLAGPAVFDTVVLAAADVAPDVLEPGQPMAPLLDSLARRVVVTVYRGDTTLTALSEPRNGPRLGARGPRDAVGAPPNLFAVDCYRIIQYDELERPAVGGGGTDWNDLRHQYYRNQPLVRDQLARALGGAALPLDSWRSGRPERTIALSAQERVAPFYWYAEATPQA